MKIQQIASMLNDAKFDLDVAISHGAKINQKREALRNVLENCFGDIMEVLNAAADLEHRVDVLTVEVNDADRELDEKDDEIKTLKAQIEELKAQPARKKKEKADGEQG